MSSLNAPEPAPTAGEGDEVWPMVFDSKALVLPDWLRADMRERHAIGTAKYGTGLRTWNGRCAVTDAYQEALDLIVYTRQARERMGPYSLRKYDSINVHLALDLVLHNALQMACHLGELARAKKVPTTKEATR